MTALRYIDLVLLWLTVPLALALGAPALGLLLGSVVWTVQRGIALAVDRKARTRDNVREAIGLNMATMMVRMWLVVGAVLVAGLGGQREDGAAAAAVLLVVFTISFATRLLTHSLERSAARAGTASHA
ncbi:MAG: hypothetical protein Q8O56_16630 [Solirubrobacteraceae bacterium]|nr:hypothetical protein [Solirubrobacteraceae bacterium]